MSHFIFAQLFMHQLILNKNLIFHYNPFGGISDSELAQVIIPHAFINKIHHLIHTENKVIIELVGAKGRGKTSHLKLIHQQCFNVGGARIYWQLLVKVSTTLGFQFTYKAEFTVTKEKLIA